MLLFCQSSSNLPKSWLENIPPNMKLKIIFAKKIIIICHIHVPHFWDTLYIQYNLLLQFYILSNIYKFCLLIFDLILHIIYTVNCIFTLAWYICIAVYLDVFYLNTLLQLYFLVLHSLLHLVYSCNTGISDFLMFYLQCK